MKLFSIQAMKDVAVKSLNPKKADKVATATVEDGEKLITTAQDAVAAQGKAMIKPYQKPQMEEIQLKREKLVASSGDPFGPKDGGDLGGDDGDEAGELLFDDAWGF